MERSINILNFDNVYLTQTFHRGVKATWIDFTDLRNVSRLCELSTLKKIELRLGQAQHLISFMGNGNYHYVTLLFLRKLQVPFTLVLFDHHTDMLISPSESLISCGSWVTKAIQTLPLLEKVILVGTADELVKEIPPFFRNKVAVFTQEQAKRLSWLKHSIGASIPTQAIYISIDKDVLSKSEVATNWDQGEMNLTQLSETLNYLGTVKDVLGIDVSGEYSIDPLMTLSPTLLRSARLNSRANRALLRTVKKIAAQAS